MTSKKAAAAPPAETYVNADRQPEPPDPKTLVRVYPSRKLPAGSFLPGVGIAGADVAPELAAEWIKAGLATRTAPPARKPATKPEG